MAKRILVVEDSPTQARIAKFILEDNGFMVEIAENGQIGLEIALANPPDLVITDITMPVMDGYEMTHELRANPKSASLPIFMLTALDHPIDIIRGLEVGADHFINKPYNHSRLINRVQAFFEQNEKAPNSSQEQQELKAFDQEILITPNREQILQNLLIATSRITNCQAMALLLDKPKGNMLLFFISYFPHEKSLLEKLNYQMVDVLKKVKLDLKTNKPSRVIDIIVDSNNQGILGDELMQSFLHTPLIMDGNINGLLGVFNCKPDAFDIKHVRFLFEMGQKAAGALNRIRVA